MTTATVHDKRGYRLYPMEQPDYIGRAQASQRQVERRKVGALYRPSAPLSEDQEEELAAVLALPCFGDGFDGDDTQPVRAVKSKHIRDYAPAPRIVDRDAPMATRDDGWVVEKIALVVIGALVLFFLCQGWMQ